MWLRLRMLAPRSPALHQETPPPRFHLPAIVFVRFKDLQDDLVGLLVRIGCVPAVVDLVPVGAAHLGHLVLADEAQFIRAGSRRPAVSEIWIVDGTVVLPGVAVEDKLRIARIVALIEALSQFTEIKKHRKEYTESNLHGVLLVEGFEGQVAVAHAPLPFAVVVIVGGTQPNGIAV